MVLGGGVAVMAIAGYLVAALVMFPSPLLPNEREVPRAIGLNERESRRVLEQAGFGVATERAPHTTVPAGLVTWQDPPPGLAAVSGRTVTLTVSSGVPNVLVPSVIGLDFDLAIRMLASAGLRLEGSDSITTPDMMPGLAVGTTPAAGDSVQLGRGIIVHLSR